MEPRVGDDGDEPARLLAAIGVVSIQASKSAPTRLRAARSVGVSAASSAASVTAQNCRASHASSEATMSSSD
jgi:hypothetical protein